MSETISLKGFFHLMRYLPIDASLFVKNRERFAKKLKQNAIAVFHSTDLMPISADATHPFVQHPDLFYLCGIDQEDTVLLICPDAREKKTPGSTVYPQNK